PARPATINPFLPDVAKPATVYRVRLAGMQTFITRASRPGRLVYPQALAIADGIAYLCDPGMPPVASQDSTWRVHPQGFGVIVHFPISRLPTDPKDRSAAMNKVFGAIRDIISQESPAQAFWEFFTQSGV